MYAHPEVVVALLGLVGLAAFFIPFVGYVIQDFQQIKTTYSTISAFSASPTGWANKFLLCVTFISGYSLVILLLSEFSSQSAFIPPWEIGLQIALCFSLVLIGIFYTDGSHRQLVYVCGGRNLPIGLSTLIHSLSALGFMIIMPILHLRFLFSFSPALFASSKFLQTMCALTLLDLVILLTFLTLQGVIATPLFLPNQYKTFQWLGQWCSSGFLVLQQPPHYPALEVVTCELCDNGASHNAEYGCRTCKHNFCLTTYFAHQTVCGSTSQTAPLVGVTSPNWPPQTRLRSEIVNDRLYVVSFILEGCLVVLTLGITALLSLARNTKLEWNWI
jgi:hypothetical protein